MSDTPEAILKLYEGALRALDTKAQVFLAFIAITISPVMLRMDSMDLPYWVRVLDGLCVAGATLAFVFCLMPRRGRRVAKGIFDTSLTGQALTDLMAKPDFSFTLADPISVMHDIYRLKTRSVSIGTALVAVYILSVAISFAVA